MATQTKTVSVNSRATEYFAESGYTTTFKDAAGNQSFIVASDANATIKGTKADVDALYLDGYATDYSIKLQSASAYSVVLKDDSHTVTLELAKPAKGKSSIAKLYFLDGSATLAVNMNKSGKATFSITGDDDTTSSQTISTSAKHIDTDFVILGEDQTSQDYFTPETFYEATLTAASAKENSKSLVFTVDLGEEADGDFDLSYSISFGTGDTAGKSDIDLKILTGTAAVKSGDSFVNIEIPVVDDSIQENDETFTLTVSGKRLTETLTTTGTIENDDVSLYTATVEAADVTETSKELTFKITLDQPAYDDITLVCSTSDSTAKAGSDYTAVEGKTLTLKKGETVGYVAVSLSNDSTKESTEAVQLTVKGSQLTADASAYGQILDDDKSSTTYSVDSVTGSASESAGKLKFYIELDKPAATDISLSYMTVASQSKATSGEDFTPTSGTIAIAKGSASATVEVSITDDKEVEESEKIALRVSGDDLTESYVGFGTVKDDDTTTSTGHTLFVTSTGASESATSLAFTLTLDRPADKAIALSYGVDTGSTTATPGTDFESVSGTVSFAAGESSKTINVTLKNDTDVEGAETIGLRFSGTDLAAAVVGVATITDDDVPAAKYVANISSTPAEEKNDKLSFTVTLDKAATKDVTLNYSVIGDTALAGSDFLAPTGTSLTFKAGEIQKTIDVSLIDDTTKEETESLKLKVEGTDLVSKAENSGFILDNDATATKYTATLFDDTTNLENGGKVYATVVLDKAADHDITLDYKVLDWYGSATPTSDYTSAGGKVTILKGSDSATFAVASAVNDTAHEDTETLMVQVSGTDLSASTSGLVSLQDDDASKPYIVTLNDQKNSESDGGLTVGVHLERPAESDFTIEAEISDYSGTATPGSDYASVWGKQTFLVTKGTQDISLWLTSLYDDANFEGDETVQVKVTGDNLLSQVSKDITIVDNDKAQYTATVSDWWTEPEGGQIYARVDLDHAATSDVTLNYWTLDYSGTATVWNDYQPTYWSSITIPVGSYSADIPVAWSYDDTNVESSEYIAFQVTGTQLQSDVTGYAYIGDNDTANKYSAWVNDWNYETEGGQIYATVSLDRVAEKDVTLTYWTNDSSGTATAWYDYQPTSWNSVTIKKGSSSADIPVAWSYDDYNSESSEYIAFTVSGSDLSYDTTGYAYIQDNDTASKYTATAYDWTYETEGGQIYATISLDRAAEKDVTLNYWTNDYSGTATAWSDYQPTYWNSVTIKKGSYSADIPVAWSYEDYNSESSEYIAFTVSGTDLSYDTTGYAYIQDNDTASKYTATAYDWTYETEGGQIYATVSLDRAAEKDLTLSYWTNDYSGTATAYNDYQPTYWNSVTIKNGSSSVDIPVAWSYEDYNSESSEYISFTVSGSDLSYDTTGYAYIQDNDTASTGKYTATIDSSSWYSQENYGPAWAEVKLDHAATETVSLSWSTDDYSGNTTATPGWDYSSSSGNLTIYTGSQSAWISIPVYDDYAYESTEQVGIKVTGTSLSSDASGTIKIYDNEYVWY